MKTKDFQVTTADFDNYLDAQGFDEKAKATALAREGAVAQVFENFYLLRSLAADGARNEAIDKEQVEWMVANYRDKILMERQLELKVNKAMETVDLETLAEEEYKANKPQYERPEEVKASHILISLSDRTEEEAEAIANTVMEKLEAGEDFKALVMEYSDDEGSKVRDGGLGYFTRGRMVKPFEEGVDQAAPSRSPTQGISSVVSPAGPSSTPRAAPISRSFPARSVDSDAEHNDDAASVGSASSHGSASARPIEFWKTLKIRYIKIPLRKVSKRLRQLRKRPAQGQYR